MQTTKDNKCNLCGVITDKLTDEIIMGVHFHLCDECYSRIVEYGLDKYTKIKEEIDKLSGSEMYAECYACGETQNINSEGLCQKCQAEFDYFTKKFGVELVMDDEDLFGDEYYLDDIEQSYYKNLLPSFNEQHKPNVNGNKVNSNIAEFKLTPRQILDKLNDTVISQDNPKKVLATEIYKHYLRINHIDTYREKGYDPQKTNIIMTGVSGTGKTLIAKTLAKIVGVPFVIADATGMTEAGYVGEDVESMLYNLIQAADGDIELAEKGIIYLDEVDKIARKGENMSITRDVSGEGVQQAILKIVEGTTINVPSDGGRKNPYAEMIPMDTSNILFIAGGAFSGIEDIVKLRLKKEKGDKSANIGFGAKIEEKDLNKSVETKETEMKELRSKITQDDLKKFGLIPELLGRFQTVANLNPLTREDLISILTDSKNSIIKNYEILFEIEGKKLVFEKESLEALADLAIKRGVGARGLHSVVDEVMLDILFELPEITEDTIVIDKLLKVKKLKKLA